MVWNFDVEQVEYSSGVYMYQWSHYGRTMCKRWTIHVALMLDDVVQLLA